MNQLPYNLEMQYLKYARSIERGPTMMRREWLRQEYPGYKGEWR